MGAEVWKQRRTGRLSALPLLLNIDETEVTTESKPSYLHPVIVEGSNEVRYYFKNGATSSLSSEPTEYSFEESFLLLPDFFDFVEYSYDPETKKATIIPPAVKENPRKVEFIFEKLLLNLERKDSGQNRLSPTAVHPCDGLNGGAASTTISNNCMAPIMTEDGNFVVMYAKDSKNKYRTDVTGYQIRLNNYLIPTLSADMSVWWYRIPNHQIDSNDDSTAEWNDDDHARENAEIALSIWHQDYDAFKAALTNEEFVEAGLESKFFIGVYQRSYFSDELQMRFVNIARIGNDDTVKLILSVRDHSTIRYKPLKENFAETMLGF